MKAHQNTLKTPQRLTVINGKGCGRTRASRTRSRCHSPFYLAQRFDKLSARAAVARISMTLPGLSIGLPAQVRPCLKTSLSKGKAHRQWHCRRGVFKHYQARNSDVAIAVKVARPPVMDHTTYSRKPGALPACLRFCREAGHYRVRYSAAMVTRPRPHPPLQHRRMGPGPA